MLAAKTALAVRYDALGEEVNTEMGVENRARLEIRIRNIEDGKVSTNHQPDISYYFVGWKMQMYFLISMNETGKVGD